jgi:hypothetical protein
MRRIAAGAPRNSTESALINPEIHDRSGQRELDSRYQRERWHITPSQWMKLDLHTTRTTERDGTVRLPRQNVKRAARAVLTKTTQ